MKTLLSTLTLLALPTVSFGCELSGNDLQGLGKPGQIKLFHVKGSHQCQSRDHIGYMIPVELFDATDCGNGHVRLRMQNPCGWWNGQVQSGGRSINYVPGSCSSRI